MAAAGATPASASLVGNAFISQYYNVLHQSPSVVHRFYTDQSQLTRDTGDGSVATVSTQQEINAKIMAMDLTDFKAEIKSVVSQNSLNGGVLVMVTGTLSCQSTGKRSFVQTFFLAPQEKGYFVLNDVLRYVDEPKPLPYSMANGVADATVPSIPQQAEQFESEELVTEESYVPEEYVVLDKPAEKAAAAAAAAEEPRSDAVVVEEPVTVVEVETVSEETTVTLAVEPEEPVKKTTTTTTTKMSYASIVNQPGRPAPQFVPKPAAAAPAAPAPAAAAAAPASGTVEEASIEGPGIFISNLTLDATDEEIQSKFREFGAIKPGSLQIKTSKERTYAFAFLDFQDQQSAANAVEASGSVDIAGRMTKVEYKKPIGAGRGRGYAGRDREGGRGGGGGGYDREGGGRGGGYDREGGGGRGGGGFGRRTDNTDEAGFRRQDQRSSRRGSYGRGPG